jgi:hypothetical protein
MDRQTLGCHRLLCSVIALALRDLCHKPLKHKKGYSLNPNARTAFDFFFRNGVANRYLNLLGYDAQVYKQALLRKFNADKKSTEARSFRYNFDRYLKEIRQRNPSTKLDLGG